MTNPVVYIFLNKGLHMSVGKAAAQAAHAAMVVWEPAGEKVWLDSMHRTIIVLEARDENHMRSIRSYLAERKFKTNEIIDEGVNEIDPHTITALSTNILDKDDENTIRAFSSFKLYRDFVEITTKFER
jgi:peptidyl-tRNA hydrolase